MPENTSLLQFPCAFPLKIMGLANEKFETAVFSILCEDVPDLVENSIKQRLSKDGKYLALTVVINATNQAQLDAIYQKLTACSDVLMAL